MEQSNMKPRGNGGPKMPRFNMTWLFTICLITMIILFFTGGGDAMWRAVCSTTFTCPCCGAGMAKRRTTLCWWVVCSLSDNEK